MPYPARVDLATKRAAPETSVLRRAGSAVGPVLSWIGEHLPPVVAVDALRRGAVAAQGGAADFVEGVAGLDQGYFPRAANSAINPDYVPSTAVVRAAAPKAVAAKVAAAPKAAAATTEYPDIAITPQMRAMAEINSVLSRPHTREEALQYMAAMPAPVKPASGVNAVAEAGASIAGRMYAQRIAAAQQLTDADAQAKEIAAANNEYVSRMATFTRANPADLAQAGLLGQVPE